MTFAAVLGVITDIVAPLFSVALIGLLAGVFRVIPSEGVRPLNSYVYIVATPALLFLGISNIDFFSVFRLDWVLAYYIPTLGIHILVVWLLRKLCGFSLLRSGVLGQGATFSNSVVIGLPITYAAWGETALPQALTIIGLHMVVHHSLITTLAAVDTRRQKIMSLQFLGELALSFIRHPIVLSVAAGLIASLVNFKASGGVASLLELLARSQAPVGLFTLGLALSMLRISGALWQSALIVAVNSLILPLAVYVCGVHVFELEALTIAVLVMIATCPIGLTANFYAIHYETAQRVVATGVVVSTLISIPALSFVVVALSP